MSLPFKIDLSGKVAVVTGGGGILCSGMSKAIAECGAKVAILDLRKEAADKVADEIKAAGGTAMGVACNVFFSGFMRQAVRKDEKFMKVLNMQQILCYNICCTIIGIFAQRQI